MTTQHHRNSVRMTRRTTLVAGAGVILGLAGIRNTLAQATPAASPVAGTGYHRPDMLVDPVWLVERRDDPTTFPIAFMPAEAFENGHVPGSLQIDFPDLEVTDTSDESIAAWLEHLETIIGDLGITPETTVVAYDHGTGYAARLWWVLHWMGHERICILNGGLAAWEDAGHEVETGPVVRTLEAHPPYESDPNHAVLAQKDEVLGAIEAPNTLVIDARPPEAYAEGHIPGAVNVPYTSNLTDGEPAYWRPGAELRDLYEQAGVTEDTRAIAYCQTGVQSSVTVLALYLIGHDAELYTGSMAEWDGDPETPVETGS